MVYIRYVKVLSISIVLLYLIIQFAASVGFFAGLVPPNRKSLAIYPVFLMYLVVGWMIVTVK